MKQDSCSWQKARSIREFEFSLSVMAISDEQIEELMLCPGFGNFVNIQNAKTIRLLPDIVHE